MRAALADALESASDGAGVDAALAKLGWIDLLDAEPDDAIGVVFGALGALGATSTALDDVLLSALGETPHPDVAVVLPRFGAWDPAGRIESGELCAHGLATSRADRARELRLVGGTSSEAWVASIATSSAEVSPMKGIDPTAGLHAVRARGRAADATPVDPAAWRSALALGRRAIAHQIAGATRTMLELACAHAKERVQFGRPIARFQAVRHRLADALVAVESLDAALGAALEVPGPDTAALAKAVAGRTARTVATHCQQVLGGIGFTTEHAFHRYLKRTLALEGLFGSADAIVLDVGRRLLAERRAPALIQL
ncbi:MAG TPA: acyl-CoA dehydrogenase family protein [Myxococcota bacterium]|nr:acyl-CoA dehydrogenase family protein [Myxococcota bacterium]